MKMIHENNVKISPFSLPLGYQGVKKLTGFLITSDFFLANSILSLASDSLLQVVAISLRLLISSTLCLVVPLTSVSEATLLHRGW